MSAPAILVVTESGLATARRLRAALPEATLHGRRGRVEGADREFDDTATELQRLFAAGRPIVALCASGIVIRALAPLLADKAAEPPVVAVAEDGSAVVPLLGGHKGANDLAREIAALLEVAPAITTAGDLRFGVALDDPPDGWVLANPGDAKPAMAHLLAGAKVRRDGVLPWLEGSTLPWSEAGEIVLRATVERDPGGPDRLIYHPRTLALGAGCERGADPAELIALAEACLSEKGYASDALAGVFTLDLKEDEPALRALAAHFGVPLRLYDAARLEAETPRLASPSEAVFREVGCHGVAEAAALAAAGPEGRLAVPKRKATRATCALALAPAPIDPARAGRPPGHLAVVGLGPGDPVWRTGEAAALIEAAEELVGYSGYLALLGPAHAGQRRHAFALGEEEARVAKALDLAAEGRRVALVSSGDPGIYAMAALVFELIERGGRPAWRRLAVTVAPGVSALQAAAARLGAPLGHDFCAISLSDLLTPWPVIERRLEAAAAGDFVVALYNPVSKRRQSQLKAALAILGAARPAETPVALARNLGRAGESVEILPLAEVAPERVDMLTLVLVGARATRRLARGDGGAWLYTPRGYARKAGSSEDAA